MPNNFLFEILTPDKVFYSGEIESLIVNSTNGRLGILANAISKVVSLKSGICRYLVKGEWMEIMLGNGFMEVHPKGARVFVQFAATPEEFEVMLAEEYDNQDEIYKKNQSRQEYLLAKAQLVRQFASLRIKKGNE